MKSLYDFYPQDLRETRKSLWYIQFFILAFGKSFTPHKSQERKPPGTNYFVKALQMMPDHYFLYSSPMISTEILCCIALFYHFRSPAHNYAGVSWIRLFHLWGVEYHLMTWSHFCHRSRNLTVAGLCVYLGRSLRQRPSALLDLFCLSFLCISRMLLYLGSFFIMKCLYASTIHYL